jgi:hypothetical protein
MAISAAFTVEGTTVPQASGDAVEVDFGDTVNLALLSTSGITSVQWSVFGTSSNLSSSPTLTLSGTPVGASASFVADSDQGDGNGVSYGLCCVVSDGKNTATSYGAVGVPAVYGEVPPISGEGLARSATQGWTKYFSDAAMGFPHTAAQFASTDATAATAATVAIPTGKIVKIVSVWSAVETSGGTDRLMRESVAYFQNDSGTVTQNSTTIDTINSKNDATWDADYLISGTNVLIRYQGDATNPCDWRVFVFATEWGN